MTSNNTVKYFKKYKIKNIKYAKQCIILTLNDNNNDILAYLYDKQDFKLKVNDQIDFYATTQTNTFKTHIITYLLIKYIFNIDKKYIVKLNDKYKLQDSTTIDFEIELKLTITPEPISFNIDTTAWSNEEQKYVTLEDSIIVEFLSNEEALECIKYYENIKTKYLKFLQDTIITQEQLFSFLIKLENSKITYNYKLLNVFSIDELNYISNVLFKHNVLLDINNFNNFIDLECNGWLFYNIEVSTDLDNNDYPKILQLDFSNKNNLPKTISAQEALNIMKRIAYEQKVIS